MKIRKKDKRRLFGLGMLTYVSGAALFVFTHWVRVSSPVGEQHHAAEYWVRLSHSALTYLIVLAMGYLLKSHVMPSLRARDRKRAPSGVTNLSVFAFLLVSALIGLYGSEQAWVSNVMWVHAIVGLGTPALIGFHSRERIEV